MMDIDVVKLIWLFVIGTFMAFLFWAQELIIEKEMMVKYNLLQLSFLAVSNSILGGLVCVIVYYGMVQFAADWHDFLKIGIAGAFATFGSEAIRIGQRIVRARANKNA